jgi:hypothetical protein
VASSAPKRIAPNENAERMAPWRQPAREADAIITIANIQMVMAKLKGILPKMHDQNEGG